MRFVVFDSVLVIALVVKDLCVVEVDDGVVVSVTNSIFVCIGSTFVVEDAVALRLFVCQFALECTLFLGGYSWINGSVKLCSIIVDCCVFLPAK